MFQGDVVKLLYLSLQWVVLKECGVLVKFRDLKETSCFPIRHTEHKQTHTYPYMYMLGFLLFIKGEIEDLGDIVGYVGTGEYTGLWCVLGL